MTTHHTAHTDSAVAFGPPSGLPFWDGPDRGDLTLDPPFITFTDELGGVPLTCRA